MVFIHFPFSKTIKYFDDDGFKLSKLEEFLALHYGDHEFSLYYNGKKLHPKQIVPNDGNIYVTAPLPGGKGGFGSMLRAIGAQIEKTTNREACRDLSGRRLRDINEETRLKKWLSKESERRAEKERRRRERIERLKSKPKHNFADFEYEKEISTLPEKIDEALTKGIEMAGKGNKRAATDAPSTSKKARLWLADEASDSSDSDSPKVHSSESKSDAPSSESTDNSNSADFNQAEKVIDKGKISSEEKHATVDIIEENIPVEEVVEPTPTIESLDDKTAFNSSIPEADSSNSIVLQEPPSEEQPLDKKLTEEQPCSDAAIDLPTFRSQLELESLGLETLKMALAARGLKCGGTLADRAGRLWQVRGLKPEQYPTNLLSKNKKMTFV